MALCISVAWAAGPAQRPLPSGPSLTAPQSPHSPSPNPPSPNPPSPRSPASQEAIPLPVQQALAKAGLPPEALALAVLPVGPARKATWLHQADRPMQPASAMKVVTTAVALDRLGPNERGYTELRTTGAIADGRLQGDLIVRGGADPELGVPQLWGLMLELREAGVRQIEGDIVLDRTLFSPARMDIGVAPFDDRPEFPYNLIPDALQLAGNVHGLEIRSTRQDIRVRQRPELPGVRLDNQLRLHEPGTVSCAEWRNRGWRTPEATVQADGEVVVRLHGSFPADCVQQPWLQLMERNLLAQAHLRWVWKELGGHWTGRVREAAVGEFVHDAPRDGERAAPAAASRTRLLARREARPWGEWLRPLNKNSDNVASRLLYLLLGVEEARRAAALGGTSALNGASGEPGEPGAPGSARSTRVWADLAVRRWFTERGIAVEGLVMDNGSGLSRTERITARQLAQVLLAARTPLHGPELLMSLPIAGVDGSLRSRMVDTPARGRARLKPGTLRDVVALAGYVEDHQGRLWVMAAMINHDEAPQKGRPVLDALADWVASGAAQGPSR